MLLLHSSIQQLLLSYHRRLRMISEAPKLYVEGGRVSYSWCTCVVGHAYGWFGGAGMEVVDGMYAGRRLGELVACREMPEHFSSATSYADDIRSHRQPFAQLWEVLSGIGRFSWKAFKRDATKISGS